MGYDFSHEALFQPATRPVFVGADRMPAFQPRAEGLHLGNAWWLANAAHLAYYERDGVARELARVGMELVEFFDVGSTQGFLAAGATFAVLSFRGTQATDLADLRADAMLFLTPAGGDRAPAEGPTPVREPRSAADDARPTRRFPLAAVSTTPATDGRVHQGFQEALDPVWSQVNTLLVSFAARGLPVWYTGHSLGAALSTLAASRRPPAGLVTFGSPRVGNEAFVRDLDAGRIERFVHCCDVIPTLPPELLGYRHAGTLRFLTSGARLRVEPTAGRLLRDQVLGVYRYAAHLPWFRPGMVKVRFLVDHAIPNYEAAIARAFARLPAEHDQTETRFAPP
ncbi:MAG: lipase family protein [Planctomycetes bacterium]|nr:lipase family protein [Planctomycetota bacterium]